MFFFEISGPEFICWYILLTALSTLAAFVLKSSLVHVSREEIPDAEIDQYDIAYLSGGPEQVFLSAVGTLGRLGALDVGKTSRTFVLKGDIDPSDFHELEKLLYRSIKLADYETVDRIFKRFEPETKRVRRRLASMHLAPSEGREILAKAMSTFIIALFPVVVGIPRLLVGIGNGKPVSILLFLLVASGILVLYTMSRPIYRTSLGAEALEKLRNSHDALRVNFRTCPTALSKTDVTLAYALFGGLMVLGLVDPFASAKAAMQPVTTGASGGSCGSSCSGCGGGCGGCGGCGG